jgi:hypothetical protein
VVQTRTRCIGSGNVGITADKVKFHKSLSLAVHHQQFKPWLTTTIGHTAKSHTRICWASFRGYTGTHLTGSCVGLRRACTQTNTHTHTVYKTSFKEPPNSPAPPWSS